MEMCRHCQMKKRSRPKGLCWQCSQTPEIRESYTSTSKFGRRGICNFSGVPALPRESTQAEPGSEEKILILMQRAENKEQLFHPEDKSIAPDKVVLGKEWKPRCFFRISDEIGQNMSAIYENAPIFEEGTITKIGKKIKVVGKKKTRAECLEIQRKLLTRMFRRKRRKSNE